MRMWGIQLASAAMIAGAIRYPVEGEIPVTEADAERLLEQGVLHGEPRDLSAREEDDEDDDLDRLKVDDLKKIAADDGVDLGDATTKAAIISAIRAHRADAGE